MSDPNAFTPALGRAELTGSYDRTIRFWTREMAWRPRFIDRIDPRPDETIVDVGCGTGTLAIALAKRCPQAKITGVDPDPQVLALARAKADDAGVIVDWREGFARDAALLGDGACDKAVSSLVFHQVPIAEKRAGLAAMMRAVRRGGSVHVADYAWQRGPLMRMLFALTVQRLDGKADTQPNADGMIETLFDELGMACIGNDAIIATPTGAITLFQRQRAALT